MTAKCQLKASAESNSLDGCHHRLVCSLHGVDHRYQRRPGHVCPKLLDVRPCYKKCFEGVQTERQRHYTVI